MVKSACVYIECPVTKMILGVTRKDDPYSWGLPGGKIEGGESPLDAAKRELYEETGIILQSGRLVEIFRREDSVTFGVPFLYTSVVGFRRAAQGEGRVAWVQPELLIAGPFGKYNCRLLKKIGRIPKCLTENCPCEAD